MLHSGEDFKCSVVVDDDVIAKCKKNIDLGPLHMPGNISCVEACREVMDVPMVLVFDTTFHATMPPKAFMYGIPYEIYDEYKVRKYGFHGTSHKYIAGEAREWLGGDKKSSSATLETEARFLRSRTENVWIRRWASRPSKAL